MGIISTLELCFMSPVSLLPILPIILVALGTMKLSGVILGVRPAEERCASIDGLRGYMAFFVFLHHACLWYFVMHGHGWGLPPSNVYSQFGSTCVAVFFMITSFLFFSRLLQARKGEMDWLKLYVSRSFRIMPLYLFALIVVVTIVGFLSHFILREPPGQVLKEILQWLAFIKADINGVNPTWPIIARVIWSLPYEWLFYFSLPFLGLLLGMRIPILVWVFSLAGFFFFLYVILVFYTSRGFLGHIAPFLSGIAAAFLVRIPQAKVLASGPVASAFIAVLLIIGVAWFRSLHEIIPFLLVSVAFVGIACGNSIFGILTHPLSRSLGQISYSIYLLHGIVLYVTFTWILGFRWAGQLSPLIHWEIIVVCSICMVIICSLTYHFIERPGMHAAPTVTKKLRKRATGTGILKNA